MKTVKELTPQELIVQSELQEEFASKLGLASVKDLPFDVSPTEAGVFLNLAKATLSVWRTTGRYNLEYYKAGKTIRYRVPSLIRFKQRRLHNIEEA